MRLRRLGRRTRAVGGVTYTTQRVRSIYGVHTYQGAYNLSYILRDYIVTQVDAFTRVASARFAYIPALRQRARILYTPAGVHYGCGWP